MGTLIDVLSVEAIWQWINGITTADLLMAAYCGT